MSARVAITIIAALLLVHLTTVALLVYAFTHAPRGVSFPLVERKTAVSGSQLSALNSQLRFSSFHAAGPTSGHTHTRRSFGVRPVARARRGVISSAPQVVATASAGAIEATEVPVTRASNTAVGAKRAAHAAGRRTVTTSINLAHA